MSDGNFDRSSDLMKPSTSSQQDPRRIENLATSASNIRPSRLPLSLNHGDRLNRSGSLRTLRLTPKRSHDLDIFSESSSSAKRSRISDNFNAWRSKNESHPSTIDPLSSRRSTTSRFSHSSPPTTPTNSDYKFRPSFGGTFGRDSPSSCLNHLNLSTDANSSQKGSFFYPGKTVFGGANLWKNARRGTPYASVNVRFIEPTPPKKPVASGLQEELHLSSVTQRILDRLEKATTPIRDARSRILTTSHSETIQKKHKLFDTTNPDLESHGRCRIDTRIKPVQYVLKPVTDDDEPENPTKDKSIEDDIQKLNKLKQAEKELNLSSSSITALTGKQSFDTKSFVSEKSSGKITSRDVKKGRKIDDILEVDTEHLKSLEKVQPLVIQSTLKPFTLKTSLSQPEKTEENVKKSTSDNLNRFASCDKVDNEPSSSLFKFSSPKLVASLGNGPNGTISVSSPSTVNFNTTINFSSPAKVDYQQQNKSFSSNTLVDRSKSQSFETLPNVPKPEIEHAKANSLFNPLKKNVSNVWSCPICCTENDLDVGKCVACEEPNPKKKSETAKPQSVPEIKFGIPSSTPIASSSANFFPPCTLYAKSSDVPKDKGVFPVNPSNIQKQNTMAPSTTTGSLPSLNDLFKKKKQDSDEWKCPACDVSNEKSATKCVCCEQPNPSAPKPVVDVKTFGFKFGAFGSSTQPEVPPKSQDGWQCYYCKGFNQDSKSNTCGECHKIKVVAATKDQMQKFVETQEFKFGAKKPQSTESGDKSTSVPKDVCSPENKIETISKVEVKPPQSTSQIGFKFGENSTLAEKPVTFSAFGSAVTSSTTATTEPIVCSKPEMPKIDLGKTTGTFVFGTKSLSASFPVPATSTSLPDKKASVSESIASKSSLFSLPETVTDSSVKKPEISTAPALPSSTFSFGSKTDSTEGGIKVSFVAPPQPTSGTSDVSAAKIPSMFNFGVPKTTEETSKVTTTTTNTTSNFVFGSQISKESAPTSNIFTFGTSAAVTSAASTATTTFGKNISFGSPITVPKINPGPPLEQKIDLNFPQIPTTSSSLFNFSSKPSTQNSFGQAKTSEPSLFGNSVPTTFNFGSSAASNNTGGSFFTFGANPTESKPPQTGFNFSAAAPAPSMPTFGATNNNLNPLAQSNPVMPAFGAGPTMNNTVEPFKFGASGPPAQGLSFANPFPNPAAPVVPGVDANKNLYEGQEPSGIFNFSSNNQAAGIKRQFKKAKRRLPSSKP